MTRFDRVSNVFFYAMVIAFAAIAGDAVAQTVQGALNSSGAGVADWVRAGAMLAVVLCGIMIARGAWYMTLPMGIGVVTAAQPQEVLGWLGI